MPVTIDLDLGAAKRVASLAVNQREWSPTYNRETFGRAEDSSRIKGYTAAVSRDGTRWTQVTAGVMPSARGIQLIDLDVAKACYIRLAINSTWGSPTVPAYYNKLGIDELNVAHDNVTGAGGRAGTRLTSSRSSASPPRATGTCRSRSATTNGCTSS